MNSGTGESVFDISEKLLSRSQALRGAKLRNVTPLSGDASGRRYFTLSLEQSRLKSLVLLLHGDVKGPRLTGGQEKTQETAMAELAPFLRSHGIPVPSLFIHDPESHALLFENIGELPLWRFARFDLRKEGEAVAEILGEDFVFSLFSKAIDIIALYQAIPVDEKCIAFRRGLAFENYRAEIAEFSDFYCSDRGLRPSEREVLNKVHDAICETIMSFPRVLVHFDFNAWNLFVNEEGEIRVVDFQDASLASPARDLLSLLNDRGMDETIGRSMQERLARYYMTKLAPGPLFPFIYDMTLLHWDFRVSGRFVKLNRTFATDRYNEWLPGTLRRLGHTLMRTWKSIHGLSDAMEIAMRISPEVREGTQDTWNISWGDSSAALANSDRVS